VKIYFFPFLINLQHPGTGHHDCQCCTIVDSSSYYTSVSSSIGIVTSGSVTSGSRRRGGSSAIIGRGSSIGSSAVVGGGGAIGRGLGRCHGEENCDDSESETHISLRRVRVVSCFVKGLVEELDLSKAAMIARQPKAGKVRPKISALDMEPNDDRNDDNVVRLPFAIRDQELIKRAFAGADVVGEFEAEKRQTIEDEDEKIIDNTLPGWGSWTGDGVNKRNKQRNKGRFLTKSEGIKEQNRKDAKLERVIINEKRVKKNGKYLASNLPHPFENRQQYERSLRLPVGPEWTTKETFQDTTKPRILLKQGIIAPMSKPLL